MSSKKNKRLLQTIFSALATGNGKPLISTMAEDMNRIWMGSGALAKKP